MPKYLDKTMIIDIQNKISYTTISTNNNNVEIIDTNVAAESEYYDTKIGVSYLVKIASDKYKRIVKTEDFSTLANNN